MPAIEKWGSATWLMFHILIAKIANESVFQQIYTQLFEQIKRICRYLPCPECSGHASAFLATVKMEDINTIDKMKYMMYCFHNKVNARKRKPLFNSQYLNTYEQFKIMNAVNNFLTHYHTKGNMNMLTESFQRKMVITQFKHWLSQHLWAFAG